MPRKNRLFLRLIALILVGAFCASDISHAAAGIDVGAIHESPLQMLLQDPGRFEVPSEFCKLQEIYKSSESGVRSSEKE